ncbi:MAG: PQQ-like beta-propeller repeat protein, partial [Planctomycetota bacterium]|nr:PQQ-like beta-propeller repeat protein [Planctomycetota bacterium]
AYTVQDAPPLEPVYVSVEGNEAYCSTGKGVVLAVDGELGKVLWAARYARSMPAADVRMAWLRQQDLCTGWQRGAPVVAGDIVAFAPSDADAIMGLDRADGRLKWEARRDGCEYLIGAWNGRLYCGGPGRAAAYCLRTGKMLWVRDVPGVTGVAVVTPSSLWIPSGSRLVGLSLEDGGMVGEITVQTPEGEPIGNVLFDGERLLAVGPSRIFALIHLDKALADAGRRVESRPGDLQALLDRGLLLLAGGRHEDAIRDLESVLAKAPGGGDPTRKSAMSALRRALLGRSASVKGEAAAALLDRALEVSATPEEKGEVRQAMIEARLKAGEPATAWELARKAGEEVGWDLMEAGKGWKVAGLAWAEEAERKIAAALPADARAGVEAKGRKALEEAGDDVEALAKVFRLYSATAAGDEALARAARKSAEAGNLEAAELLLRRLSRSPRREGAALGLALLGRLHLDRGRPDLARFDFEALAKNYGKERIVMEGRAAMPAAGGPEGAARPAEEIAREGLIEAAKLATAPGTPSKTLPSDLVPPLSFKWSLSGNMNVPLIPVGTSGETARHLADSAFLIKAGEETLACYDPETGKTRWTLKPAKGTDRRTATMSGVWYGGGWISQPFGQRVWCDGHVVAVPVRNELAAVGIASGRQFWARRFFAELSAWRARYGWPTGAISDAAAGNPVAMARGVTVIVAGQHELEGVDTVSGRTLWTRRFDDYAVAGIAAAGDGLLVNLGDPSLLLRLDIATGREAGPPLSLAGRKQNSASILVGNMLLYIAEGNTLRAVDAEGGTALWSVGVPENAAILADAGLGRVAAFPMPWTAQNPGVARTVFVADATTGQVLPPVAMEADRNDWPWDMVFDGERYYLWCQGQEGISLAAADPASGRILWRYRPENRQQNLIVSRDAAASGCAAIPVCRPILKQMETRGHKYYTTAGSELVFLDRKTGKLAECGPLAKPDGSRQFASYQVQASVSGGKLLVLDGGTLYVYGPGEKKGGEPAKK